MGDVNNLVFDFDGTLIDSSSSILEAMRSAFAACSRQPLRPLAPALIGPPLAETLALLAGSQDPALLRRLIDAFKAHYDESGYRLTRVFPGVEEMLARLAAAGYPMFIATNKRLHPTRLILSHLGWQDLFRGVYALDAFDPPLPSKSSLLGKLLGIHGLDARATLYIGDRDEDGTAAAANAMPFAWAGWGYSDPTSARPRASMHLAAPAELLRQLAPERQVQE